MDQTLNNNLRSNTQMIEKENNTMEKKNHTLWNHEERFYKVLDHLKKQLEAGFINQEEYDIMREKAIADESDLRRKDIEYTTALFGTRNAKEDEIVYYKQMIYAFIDELYISCKCSFKEKKEVKNIVINYISNHSKSRGQQLIKRDKTIYEDLISGKLDILHTTSDKLLEIYGEC